MYIVTTALFPFLLPPPSSTNFTSATQSFEPSGHPIESKCFAVSFYFKGTFVICKSLLQDISSLRSQINVSTKVSVTSCFFSLLTFSTIFFIVQKEKRYKKREKATQVYFKMTIIINIYKELQNSNVRKNLFTKNKRRQKPKMSKKL